MRRMQFSINENERTCCGHCTLYRSLKVGKVSIGISTRQFGWHMIALLQCSQATEYQHYELSLSKESERERERKQLKRTATIRVLSRVLFNGLIFYS